MCQQCFTHVCLIATDSEHQLIPDPDGIFHYPDNLRINNQPSTDLHSQFAYFLQHIAAGGIYIYYFRIGSVVIHQEQVNIDNAWVGKGEPLDEVLQGMDQVAEGINTLDLLKREADRLEVHMPLVNGLYGILYERRPVTEVFNDMMLTEQDKDVEFVTG